MTTDTSTFAVPRTTARAPGGWRIWNLVAVTALTAYSTGLSWQAQFVSYPLFGRVSAAEFPGYHLDYNTAIVGVVIVPGFLGFLATIAFLWTRPAAVSLRAAAVVAVSGLGSILSTVLWAIPAHDRLDRIGQDAATLQSLLTANAVRTGFLTLGAVMLCWIVVDLLRRRS